jgi:hypothetical protein
MTSDAPPIDKKALGHRRLAARRRRMLRIRQAVAATALSVFIALFSAIYIQMASGKDPVLAAQGSTAGMTTTATAASSTTTPADSTTDEAPTGTSTSSDGATETDPTEPAPVTTTQS